MTGEGEQPVALVTGGSKGIGRAVCEELARHGYYVAVNYHSDEAGARETLSRMAGHGGRGSILAFDVKDREASRAAVEQLAAEQGRLDVLVNNAGIAADELFVMMAAEKWHGVIDTSLHGFYNLTRPALERMVVRRAGAVVSIASVSALMGNRGQANYAAAKAGLIAASRSIAAEVGRLGIRINVVAPGLIETAMTEKLPMKNLKSLIPMARAGRPAEVARVVRFLCSDDASYITGQVISVNGGMV